MKAMTLGRERAKEILSRFGQQRILVVGDLMLDRYIYGGVSRISPEAPVPVVKVSHEKSMPGGATNVAWNVQSLGGKGGVAGVIGHDHAGAELKQLLSRGGLALGGLVESTGARTTVKTRVIAERQQVVRVDWEDAPEVTGKAMDKLCARIEREIRKATGVIIEDYGKGVISQEVVDVVLKAAAASGIPAGLDPKDNHDLRIRGITVATPNRKEAFTIAHAKETPPHLDPLQDKPLREVGDELMSKWACELLMITLGPQGIMLREGRKPAVHVPTRAREVFDVSGAGDTVIATCVLALAAGASHLEAAELANYAAGVVVGKLGTATCTQEELLASLDV